jgi:hypothetical protein
VERSAEGLLVVTRPGPWGPFLRRAIDSLAADAEPDGLSRLVAPANSGYSGCLMFEVYPWRVFYQLANPDRIIIVAVVAHPTRM